MANLKTDDPVIARFRTALDSTFGGRIERVVLYGSRARGDAGSDSDYDVAVFLRDMDDRWPEIKRLADISTEILIDTDEFVHAMPFRAGARNERAPLMREIRIEGIDR
jgi:predicted nucleotidyltransferase